MSRYFELPLHGQPSHETREDMAVRVRETLVRSVRSCLMGDVPVATALSGGLDSSIITATAAAEWRARGHAPLLACCIRYRQQGDNPDAAHARILADHLRASAPLRLEHSELSVSDYLDDVDELVTAFDEPHWEPKQLAMFRNYRRLAACGGRVVLTGEGADELFFGYYHKFPGFLNPVLDSMDAFRAAWASRVAEARRLLTPRVARPLTALMENALDRFYAPYAAQGVPPARAMQAWYLHTFLHWLLLDNDRCSMWHSLEGRFPFLTRDVVALALSLPVDWQVGGEYGEEKLMLRRAFRNLLPAAIADRPKQPLPSPMALPFHVAIADACDRAMRVVDRGFWDVIDRSRATALLAEFRAACEACRRANDGADAGAELTRYLHLHDPWRVRTPQVFALLTTARWWTLNFGSRSSLAYASDIRVPHHHV